jgi:tetratricopeptide (TPR) repeat protein
MGHQPLGPTLLNIKQRAQDMLFLDLSTARGGAATQARPETSSLATRVRYWVIGWEMAKQHPWGGVGLAGYAAQYLTHRRLYLENPSYAHLRRADNSSDEQEGTGIAHNEYVQILAELGFVGLALFLTFWGALIWRLRRRHLTPTYLTWATAAGLLAFAFSSAVSSFSFRQVPSTAVAVCLMILGTTEWAAGQKDGGQNLPTHEVVIRRPLITAALCLALALCGLLAWRAYGAMRAQYLQGDADLQFNPANPANNEAWLRKYRRALSYAPHNSGAQFGCGLLLYQMKRPAEAAAHLEAARRLGYGRAYTNLLLAFAYEQTGRLEQATALVEENLAAYPDSLLARTVYVEFLRKRGDIPKMRREQETLREHNEALALSVPLIMRMKPNLALEEARRQGWPPPYDFFAEPLQRALLQMRTYHYAP